MFGNKAVVVLNKDDTDPRALQLALMNARCAVQRQLTRADDGADLEAVISLVEQGQRALSCHAAIKRSHSIATKEISSAASKVADLIRQLDDILGEIVMKVQG